MARPQPFEPEMTEGFAEPPDRMKQVREAEAVWPSFPSLYKLWAKTHAFLQEHTLWPPHEMLMPLKEEDLKPLFIDLIIEPPEDDQWTPLLPAQAPVAWACARDSPELAEMLAQYEKLHESHPVRQGWEPYRLLSVTTTASRAREGLSPKLQSFFAQLDVAALPLITVLPLWGCWPTCFAELPDTAIMKAGVPALLALDSMVPRGKQQVLYTATLAFTAGSMACAVHRLDRSVGRIHTSGTTRQPREHLLDQLALVSFLKHWLLEQLAMALDAAGEEDSHRSSSSDTSLGDGRSNTIIHSSSQT